MMGLEELKAEFDHRKESRSSDLLRVAEEYIPLLEERVKVLEGDKETLARKLWEAVGRVEELQSEPKEGPKV